MKADFSGYATKAGLKCSDGRTIMPDAFKHQDKVRVPLVWMHGHTDPENVLGHAILENRKDGVYAYAFFNKSVKAQHTAGLVEHGDINMLSIWANQLIERSNRVIHGAIREVSLVLAGANPGALIDNITIRHSDGDQVIDDEAIIHTGLEIEVGSEYELEDEFKETPVDKKIVHADEENGDNQDDETVADVYESLSDKQKNVVHYMIGEALESVSSQDSSTQDNTAEHGNLNQEGTSMNVFEKKSVGVDRHVISHDDMKDIVKSATRSGSLKGAVEEYALAHGITDIETLFPDSKMIGDGTPEWNKRRTEWVTTLIGAARKSPFARIRTMSANITEAEARAKGYVTGAFKKEEFFPVVGRTTTPTTIYKKQALDRDDMIDITDFNVVAWLKAEMRLMLDEELARAMLIGDGRDISSEDKINEGNIRPIATDNELYTTTVNINVGDANSSMNEVLDMVIANRYKLKGTGTPNFYTTEYWIARFLTLRDADGRRMYRSLAELAMELRVNEIIAVEVMLEVPDIIGVMVNPVDYVLGADKGGEVNTFEDFDIDYNKHKYLIETRVSGALVKLKSAMVLRSVAPAAVLVVPVEPGFNPITGVVTIPTTTGVTYKNAAGTTLTAGAQAPIANGATTVVNAFPSSAGFYFATSDDDNFSFTRNSV